ncbi:MAG: recombination protein RecR [Hyphomicrobiaceae bacterium]|nr:recombination protein RecR [Hyphomicrobiaceae bacterium]
MNTNNINGPEIDRIIQLMTRLPGLGRRSARKATLELIKRRSDLLIPLANAMRVAADRLIDCPKCGNIDTVSPCTICADKQRDSGLIIVVEEIADLWALERATAIKGLFHVLGGHLSPLDGIGPDQLNITKLIERARDSVVKEIILALNLTVEGQSTAHYLVDSLKEVDVKITQLAHGVPMGGELDYMDEGTIAAAIQLRREVLL